MARNRAIVDLITQITPPVERPAERAFAANPDGFRLQFRGGESARLLRGETAAAMLDLLDDLRRDGTAVYVELADDGDAIVGLRIPALVKVAETREVPSGDVDVVLFPSHGRHTLLRVAEHFTETLDALNNAHDKDEWLLVSETDRHEIIDVRPFRGDSTRGLPKPPTWFGRLKSLIVDT
jgi:hypothetical protein